MTGRGDSPDFRDEDSRAKKDLGRGNDAALLASFVAGFRDSRAVTTPRDALPEIYRRLPAKFPPLYEQLILSYRWPETDLGVVTLLANPDGADLSGLILAIFRDPGLVDVLLPNALLPFAKAGGGDYDPVCFDMRARDKRGDAPIVRIDHEEILCNRRLAITGQIAPTFRALVETIVARP